MDYWVWVYDPEESYFNTRLVALDTSFDGEQLFLVMLELFSSKSIEHSCYS